MTTIASAVIGVVRLLNRCSATALMVLVTAGGLLGLSACSSDDGTVTFPEPPAPETRTWLFDVYGSAADDIYVGGALGVMYHFDGNSWDDTTGWKLQDMGTSAAITSIWSPPGESTFYAVGHRGHIWRNSGSGWSSMTSGTQQDLYGIGEILAGTESTDVRIQAVGANGTIRQFNGSGWDGAADVMVILDENNTPIDTLSVTKDLASILTVNYYFLGGSFFDPGFEGVRFGTAGTKGNVLAYNTLPDSISTADWILRPLSGEQRVQAEWVLCTTSDSATLGHNYLGTSEGWLFRLIRDDDGNNVWKKFYPELTDDPGAGIRDMWLDEAGNVYLVTDEGKVIYQSFDYDFNTAAGERHVLYDGTSSLVSIWGTGPDNIYFTGYYDEMIFHGVHDVVAGTFTVDTIGLAFPNKSADSGSLAPGLNEIGRPLQQ